MPVTQQPAFVWSQAMAVGVPEIDNQHRELVRMINDLQTRVDRGGEDTHLPAIFARLLKYVEFHFATEARLMTESGYPAARQHLAQHNALASQASLLRAKYSAGTEKVDGAVMSFLIYWLTHHIMEDDRKLGAFLKSRRPA